MFIWISSSRIWGNWFFWTCHLLLSCEARLQNKIAPETFWKYTKWFEKFCFSQIARSVIQGRKSHNSDSLYLWDFPLRDLFFKGNCSSYLWDVLPWIMGSSWNEYRRWAHKSMPNMTGRPGYRTMEMNGGSSASHPARTPHVPLFCTLFNKGGNRRTLRLPGEGGDHVHCAVESSPGHIRCRRKGSEKRSETYPKMFKPLFKN